MRPCDLGKLTNQYIYGLGKVGYDKIVTLKKQAIMLYNLNDREKWIIRPCDLGK